MQYEIYGTVLLQHRTVGYVKKNHYFYRQVNSRRNFDEFAVTKYFLRKHLIADTHILFYLQGWVSFNTYMVYEIFQIWDISYLGNRGTCTSEIGRTGSQYTCTYRTIEYLAQHTKVSHVDIYWHEKETVHLVWGKYFILLEANYGKHLVSKCAEIFLL